MKSNHSPSRDYADRPSIGDRAQKAESPERSQHYLKGSPKRKTAESPEAKNMFKPAYGRTSAVDPGDILFPLAAEDRYDKEAANIEAQR